MCYDKWDIRDAEVVCRQLGYNGCESLPLSFYCFMLCLLFLPASYPQPSPSSRSDPLYVLDDVHCMGTETKLSDCSHSGVGVYDCYSGQAGVICTSKFMFIYVNMEKISFTSLKMSHVRKEQSTL